MVENVNVVFGLVVIRFFLHVRYTPYTRYYHLYPLLRAPHISQKEVPKKQDPRCSKMPAILPPYVNPLLYNNYL